LIGFLLFLFDFFNGVLNDLLEFLWFFLKWFLDFFLGHFMIYGTFYGTFYCICNQLDMSCGFVKMCENERYPQILARTYGDNDQTANMQTTSKNLKNTHFNDFECLLNFSLQVNGIIKNNIHV
jgi:hypothetical protein